MEEKDFWRGVNKIMAKTINNNKRQRSLRHFEDFKPIVKYFDKISPKIKQLPKFKE